MTTAVLLYVISIGKHCEDYSQKQYVGKDAAPLRKSTHRYSEKALLALEIFTVEFQMQQISCVNVLYLICSFFSVIRWDNANVTLPKMIKRAQTIQICAPS